MGIFNYFVLFTKLLLLTLLVGGDEAAAEPQNPIEDARLITHLDRLWRRDTSQAEVSMMVNTRRYQRTMRMESWSKGKRHSLVVIRKPVKDKDIATLKAGDNIWNYLPKINRITKVPASMMSGSWMGSHFTNDDLVKDSTFEDDYDSTITFAGDRDGRSIYELTSIPKPDAAVVWGKVITLFEQQHLAPYEALYYDEEGELVRTIHFDQVEKIGNAHIPMRFTLMPHNKPGESTVITYHSITFDLPIEDSFFSLQSLKRRR